MRFRSRAESRIAENAALATEVGLGCPVGRAVVLESRLQNHGEYSWRYTRLPPVEMMRRVRPETAERWLLHYLVGGDLRALSYTREQKNEKRRGQRVRN